MLCFLRNPIRPRGALLKVLLLLLALCLLFDTCVGVRAAAGDVVISTNFPDAIATEHWRVSDSPVHCDMRVKNLSGENAYVTVRFWEYFEVSRADYIYADARYMVDREGAFVKFAVTGTIEDQLDDIRNDRVWEDVIADPATRAAFVSALEMTDFDKLRGYFDTQEYWYKRTESGDPNGQYGAFVVTEKILTSIPIASGSKGDVSSYEQRLFADESSTDAYIRWNFGGNVVLESEWGQGSAARWILLDQSSPGTARWGQALGPGEETPPLLESVEMISQPDADELYYEIYAEMEVVPDRTLSIYKYIEGNAASADDEFTFTVALEDASGHPLSGSYPYTGAGGASDGTLSSGGSVQLKGGQSITIAGLPVQTRYKVVEREANTNGYATISQGDEGTVGGATGSDSASLIFTSEALGSWDRLRSAGAAQRAPRATGEKAEAIFLNVKNSATSPLVRPDRPRPTPEEDGLVTLPEGQVPLTPGVEVTIPEGTVPLAPSPNTGRATGISPVIWVAVIALSCALVCRSGNRGRGPR